MGSDDNMTIHSSSMHECDDDDHHHYKHQTLNLSRLSICTITNSDNDDDDDDMSMFMSFLSVEGSDGDADEDLSDDKEGKEVSDESSDSDKVKGWMSVPSTPARRRRGGGGGGCENEDDEQGMVVQKKEYGSENEVENKTRRRRAAREKWLDRAWEEKKKYWRAMDDNYQLISATHQRRGSNDGDGDGDGDGNGNGRRRSLSCVDMEEVKACRDLGFERMPSRISMSGNSTIESPSSGGNSPISTWRISSPGDDPRDVKARLKVWAQAVVLASSASGHSS